MSASVVDQLLTLIRIAALPCQVVPPIQASPSAWTAAMTPRVRSSSSSKRTSNLVEDHIVEDGHAVRGAELLRHARGERAAALDQRLDA